MPDRRERRRRVRADEGRSAAVGTTPSANVRLDPDSVRAIASEVVLLLEDEVARVDRVDAHEVGRRLGRSAAWVRRHADELGAVRLGSGPRPRIKFDLREVERRLAAPELRASPRPRHPATPGQLRQPQTAGQRIELLPIRGVPA